MPKAWKEIESSEVYKTLPIEDRASMRDMYFNEVVAPQLDPTEMQEAYDYFTANTSTEDTWGTSLGKAVDAAGPSFVSGLSGLALESLELGDPEHYAQSKVDSILKMDKLRNEKIANPYDWTLNKAEQFGTQLGSFIDDAAFVANALPSYAAKEAYPEIVKSMRELGITEPSAIRSQQEPNLVEDLQSIYQESSQQAAENQPVTESAWSPKNIVAQAASSTLQNAPFLLGAALTGNPNVALAPLSAVSMGQQYGEQRAAGRDPFESVLPSIGSGYAEYIGEKLPINELLRTDIGSIFSRMGRTALADAFGEGVTEILTSAINKGTIQPDMTLEEAMNNVGLASTIGLVAGGAMGAPGHIATGIREKRAQKHRDLKQQYDNAIDVEATTVDVPSTGTGEYIAEQPVDTGQTLDEYLEEGEQRPAVSGDSKILAKQLQAVVNEETDVPELIQHSEGFHKITPVDGTALKDGEELYYNPETEEIRKVNTKTGEAIYTSTLSQIADEQASQDGTKAKPAVVNDNIDIAAAEQHVDTQPTEAQKEAGNYKKAHINVQGLQVTIENPKGSTRTGKDSDGEQWSVTMPATYGYIKQTKGADGEQVDVYVGDNPNSPQVWVIDQIDPKTGAFDEVKAFIGVDTQQQAEALYNAAFSDGSGQQRMGSIKGATMDDFKKWLSTGKKRSPFASQYEAPLLPKPERNLTAANLAESQNILDLYKMSDDELRKVATELGYKGVKPRTQGWLINKIESQSKSVIISAAVRAAAISDNTTQQSTPSPQTPVHVPQKRRKRPPKNMTLLDFIANRGGVEDAGGDLHFIGLQNWHRQQPFRKKLVRESAQKGGLFGPTTNDYSLDATALAAWEAGYFPEFSERPSVNDLLDRMEAESRGQMQTTEDNAELPEFTYQENEDESRLQADVYAEAYEMGIETQGRDFLDVFDEVQERRAIEAESDNYEQQAYAIESDIDAAFEAFFDEQLPEAVMPESEVDNASEQRVDTEQSEQAKSDTEKSEPARPEQEAEARAEESKESAASSIESQTTVEKTDQGDQRVIQGAERISDKELAERQMEKPKSSQKPQKGFEGSGGLFDTDARNQTDLVEMSRQVKTEPEPPTAEPVGRLEATPTQVTKLPTGIYTLESHNQIKEDMWDGKYSADQVRELFQSYLKNRDAIKAQLNTLTKDQLSKKYGVRFASSGNAAKKAYGVKTVLDAFMGDFYFGESFMWSPFQETQEQAYTRLIEKQTDADIQAGIERENKRVEERKQYVDDYARALFDPQTLDEYRRYVRSKGSIAEVPADKLREYDRLVAEAKIKQWERDADKRATVASVVAPEDLTMQMHKTVHTQKGHDLYVVKMDQRVEKDVYQKLNAAAKRLGGYYSKFSRGGAIPGFQFKTEDAAQQFMNIHKEDVKIEGREEKRQESRASKLRTTAENMIARAEEKLSQDRKVNTARRARMAEGMEADAQADIAMGKTMLKIAEKIESGEAGILSNISASTEVALLQQIMRDAKRKTNQQKNLTYKQEQEQKGRAFDDEDAKNIEYVRPRFWKDHIPSIVNDLGKIPGFKMLAQHLQKQAKATKDNIVLITDDKYIIKLREAVQKHGEKLPWSTEDGVKDYMRLQKLGLTNLPVLRHAIREFADLLVGKKATDPIKQAERALIGKKFDGYFPTPDRLADRMAEELNIDTSHKILEPSAGKGSLIDAAVRAGAKAENIDALEIQPALREMLSLKGYNVIDNDFMAFNLTPENKGYDRIIMNPPFEKRQDVDHVMHAYDLLAADGKMIAIMSEGPFFSSDAKSTQFRQWLEDVGGVSEKLPEGTFKESDVSTGVNTRLVTISKSQSDYQKPRFTKREKSFLEKIRTADNVMHVPGSDLYYIPNQQWTEQRQKTIRQMKMILRQSFGSKLRMEPVDGLAAYGTEEILGAYNRRMQNGMLEYFTLVSMTEDKSMRKGGYSPEFAINHEGIHFLRQIGALDQVWSILEKESINTWMGRYETADRYSDFSYAKQVEEAIADAYADYATGKIVTGGIIETTFLKIKRFLKRLRTALRGRGFQTWEDVFDDILVGKYRQGKRRANTQGNIGNPIIDTVASLKESPQQFIDYTTHQAPKSSYARVGVKRFFKQPKQSALNDMKKWVKRNFTKEGLLNKTMFEQRIRMEGRQSADELDIEAMVFDFDKDIKKHYKKPLSKLSAEQQSALNDYLSGKPADIPDGMKQSMSHMRAYLDIVSTRMQNALAELLEVKIDDLPTAQKQQVELYLSTNGAQGSIPEHIASNLALLQTIESNKGTYLHRSYQAFDDPKWKDTALANEQLVRDAYNFIAAENRNFTEDEVMGAVRAILQSAKDSGNFVNFITKGAKVGSKDVTMLKRRKDVPLPIRRLLGEYQDPKINFVRSASKMSKFLTGHYFLMGVRRKGLGSFIHKRPTGIYDTKIAPPGSQQMNPLNGLYTTEDIVQGMLDVGAQGTGPEWLNKFIAFNSAVKYGKTILAPTTQARNFMSASMFAVMNGHFNWMHANKAFKVTMSDLFTHDKKWKEYTKKLVTLGVLHDNPRSQELREAIKDVVDGKLLERRSTLRGILTFSQKLYRTGDDFWKIIGYENEKSLLMKHKGLSEKDAEKQAAFRIRNGYPTYSMVPRSIRGLRKFPLAGTFVSFPWEIFRTTKNQVMFMAQDVKDGHIALATHRAIGFIVAAASAEAISEYTMNALGLDDEDDEAVRSLAPPWQKNANIAYLGYDENGFPVYLDLSHLDPYSYLKKPIEAIVNGNNRDVPAKLVDATKEMLEPFIGPDIAAATIGEILFNKRLRGGEVFNPGQSVTDISFDIAKHLTQLLPGGYGNLERFYKAYRGDASSSGKEYKMEDEAMALVGFRLTTQNIPSSLKYRSYEFKDNKSNATRILLRKAGGQQKISNAELRDAYESMIYAYNNAYTEMTRAIAAAKKLGVSDANIIQALKAANVSDKDVHYLKQARAPRWTPSAQFMRNAMYSAMATAPNNERRKEIKREMLERRKYIMQLNRENYQQ